MVGVLFIEIMFFKFMAIKKFISLIILLNIYLFTAYGVTRFSPEEQENISIYEKSSKAVVNISNIGLNYDFFYRAIPSESGSGTGFLIDDANNGYNGSGRSYIYYAHA